MVKRVISWLVVVGVCATPSTSHAQDDEARAKEMFFKGHEAADRGEHAAACESFRQSLAYFRRVSTLLNLGKCSDAIGQIAEALRYWTESAALLEPGDPRMALAKERIAELEGRVPRLTLELPEPLPEGSVVELDGQALPPEQYASGLRLNPGVRYRLSLLVPGHDARHESVELAEGEQRQLALTIGAALEQPTTASSASVESAGLSGIQIGGVVIGAVGIAGIIVGGVSGGLVLDRKQTVDAHCADDLCTDPEGVEAAESGRTLATVSTISFIAGGVAVAAGALMLILGEEDSSEALSASVTFGPDSAGVVVVGRW